MGRKNSVVFFKQSGERLAAGGNTGVVHPSGVRAAGDKLARAYRERYDLGLEGLMVVPGAGNIIRGDVLRGEQILDNHADFAGRLATMQNALVIQHQLNIRGVPNRLFIAKSMSIRDKTFKSIPYSRERVGNAWADEEVVIIGGGTGRDNETTDRAISWYAADYKRSGGGAAVKILKGTQFDGVYQGDPKTQTNVPRYRVIGAQVMLHDYERFKVVDRPSLELLAEHDLSMLIYAEGSHDLGPVIEDYDTRFADDADTSSSAIGTLVVGHQVESQLYPVGV